MNYPYIKLTFYSGKLWHSDKPFPKTSPDQKSWYHSAYEVVNPEQAAVYYHEDLECWKTGSPNYKTLLDGDQITLPEGYGIALMMKQGHNSSVAMPHSATITLPETDYSTMITPEMNERLTKPITSFSEPSESQEDNEDDCWGVVCQIITDYQLDKNGQGWFAYLERLKSKFTITRRK